MSPGARTVVLLIAALTLLGGCGSGGDDDSGGWQDAPVVPELTGQLADQLREDVAVADAHGFRADVFAKVGDSNTELADNLYGFACAPVDYGSHTDLEPVVGRYNEVKLDASGEPGCEPVTSFSRRSAAARSGTYSTFSITKIRDNYTPFSRPDPACDLEETPLACEIRLLMPRYTIIMTGTNDLGLDLKFGGIKPGSEAAVRIGLLIAAIRNAGSVPVLSNLPPSWVPGTPDVDEWGGIIRSNERIAAIAEATQVPLINLWGALTEDQMIDRGLGPDGVHLSVYGGAGSSDLFANSVSLSDEALRYGANRRNLIWLQTLDALDEAAAG